MRLPEPSVSSRLRGGNTDPRNRRTKLLRIGSLFLLAVIAVVAIGLVAQREKEDTGSLIGEPENASSATIRLLKNSDKLSDRQSLISAYIDTENYNEATKTAKGVADQTNNTADYMSLLTICAQYSVEDRQGCIDEVVAKLSPQIQELSFYDAYTAGTMLDDAGQTEYAIEFYQRAYDVYDPQRADEYTKTKAELKSRIDELRG